MIFQDYDKMVYNESLILNALFTDKNKSILDITAGIGTQSLGLWRLGYKNIIANDISLKSLQKIREKEDIKCLNFDFCNIPIKENTFDLVIMMDNSLPYIKREDMNLAFSEIYRILNKGGAFVFSLRPYDEIVKTKPNLWKSETLGKNYYQIWKWIDDNSYLSEFYFNGTKVAEFMFSAIKENFVEELSNRNGFTYKKILENESGWFQPIYWLQK